MSITTGLSKLNFIPIWQRFTDIDHHDKIDLKAIVIITYNVEKLFQWDASDLI